MEKFLSAMGYSESDDERFLTGFLFESEQKFAVRKLI
jgi:hypothetical protein